MDEPTQVVADLIEYLVAICGESHRRAAQDAIETAYQRGRTSIAYEAALRFKNRLEQHEDQPVLAD
jgi:hypothetical protein